MPPSRKKSATAKDEVIPDGEAPAPRPARKSNPSGSTGDGKARTQAGTATRRTTSTPKSNAVPLPEAFAPSGAGLSAAFVTSELAPLVKVGGLGEVSATLAQSLAALGVDVRFFLPYYRSIYDYGIETRKPPFHHITAALGGKIYDFEIRVSKLPGTGLPLVLVANDELFARPGVYTDPQTGEGYWDNGGRYLLFSKVVAQILARLAWKPDIIHVHDYQTALVPAFIRTDEAAHNALPASRTVLTLHNLAFQGAYHRDLYFMSGLPWEQFYPMSHMEFYGGFNFMKTGIEFADHVTTVSPRYATEIQSSPEYGQGLEGVLSHSRGKLTGILNGIDTNEWDPATDKQIVSNYSSGKMRGKQTCKRDLARTMGLDDGEDRPLIGMVSRLTDQKGFDILLEALDDLVVLGVNLVILGQGQDWIRNGLNTAMERHPGRIALRFDFSEKLAHRIQAGADMLLVPSRFEPCGLTQMHAMRYGTIPIVRDTGGLSDSVKDCHASPGEGTGFKFGPYDALSLLMTVRRALAVKLNKTQWSAMQARAMAQDFSWHHSALQYLEIYKKLTGK